MAAIPAKYKPLVERFIAPYKKNPNVVGIVVTGSVVHGTPDKNSDVDVQIILKKGDWRERGNTWVDGVEFEYLINPVAQIKLYFANETQKHTAHMLANGVVAFERDPVIKQLVAQAKKVLRQAPPAITVVQRENAKYALDDGRKDLEDVFLRGDAFSFHQTAAMLVDKCIDVFCMVKRIGREKDKRLEQHLQSADPAFAKLLKAAVLEKVDKKRYRNLQQLISYTESLIGGPRPKEWKIRGPLKK
jgi:hypothetical protein